jgi:hypothetical protein
LEFAGILGVNSLDEGTRRNVSRNECTRFDRRFPQVQPQIRLAFIAILSMTIEAILSKDRPDVAIEIEFRLFSEGARRDEKQRSKQDEPRGNPRDNEPPGETRRCAFEKLLQFHHPIHFNSESTRSLHSTEEPSSPQHPDPS